MSTTMRGLAFEGIGKVGIQIRDIPRAEPGEVVIRTTAALMCTSDVHTVAGVIPVPEGRFLGHESVGVVHEIGEGVQSVAVGDRVTVSAITPDGTCSACQAGYNAQCGARSAAIVSPRRGTAAWRSTSWSTTPTITW